LLTVYQLVLDSNIDIGQSKDVIYFNMGKICYKQDDLKKAQEFLTKALAINPNNESVKSLLAEVVAKLKK
jgi:Tfp pilus assembly protein PilF